VVAPSFEQSNLVADYLAAGTGVLAGSAVVVLVAALSTAFAGDMQTPGYTGPPPPPSQLSTTASISDGETSSAEENVQDIVSDFLIDALLSVF